jgi:hypothetical protein
MSTTATMTTAPTITTTSRSCPDAVVGTGMRGANITKGFTRRDPTAAEAAFVYRQRCGSTRPV